MAAPPGVKLGLDCALLLFCMANCIDRARFARRVLMFRYVSGRNVGNTADCDADGELRLAFASPSIGLEEAGTSGQSNLIAWVL
jgi:hypothetical protein